jgi:hypothetical protein
MDTTLSAELSAFHGHSTVTSLTNANIQSWDPQHHSQVEEFTQQNTKGQANIRQELIGKLLACNGKSFVSPKDGRIQNYLSEVQKRLIDSALRHRNYSEYALNHTNNLGPQNLYPTQASDASRSMTLRENSKDAPDSMFRSTASPVHGQSSTQANVKPGLANMSTTSVQLCYPVPLKAVKNGVSVLQCPYCAYLVDETFIKDPQRWRFGLFLMSLLSRLTVVAGNISIKTSCHIYVRWKIVKFLTSATVQQRIGNHTCTGTTSKLLVGRVRLAVKS